MAQDVERIPGGEGMVRDTPDGWWTQLPKYVRAIARRLERARAKVGHLVKIEIEVDSIDQLREGLRMSLSAEVLFTSGSADLSDEGVRVLADLGRAPVGADLDIARKIWLAGVGAGSDPSAHRIGASAGEHLR